MAAPAQSKGGAMDFMSSLFVTLIVFLVLCGVWGICCFAVWLVYDPKRDRCRLRVIRRAL